MMMGGLGMGFGFVGVVLMILFWGGLIALGIWLVRGLFPSVKGSSASPSEQHLDAREILDRRFARGEISREEYELMREMMREGLA